MACSMCGKEGHNSQTCLQKNQRDRAVVVRVDKITIKEQRELANAFKEDKRRIAPEGRGTILEGSAKQLPSKPIKKISGK